MHRLSFITLVALLTSVHADLARSLRPRQATDLDRCLSKAGVDYSISSSPDWAASSHAFNRRFTYQPAAVVRPTTNEQASQAVQCAAASNIAVTSRGGGHSYVADGVGGKDGSLVVDLTAFNAVSVDASTGIATIGAGGRLGTIYSKLMQQGGRAISAGTCPFVGEPPPSLVRPLLTRHRHRRTCRPWWMGLQQPPARPRPGRRRPA
jgi:hypothetical protein